MSSSVENRFGVTGVYVSTIQGRPSIHIAFSDPGTIDALRDRIPSGLALTDLIPRGCYRNTTLSLVSKSRYTTPEEALQMMGRILGLQKIEVIHPDKLADRATQWGVSER